MKPLEGIKVLDFTQFTSGPILTVTLADFGAEVIRLENPPYGDNNYYSSPSVNKKNTLIASLDHNKKSILMNMTNEEHKALFYKMVKTADLVVDNFKAGNMKKFGADYETLSKINPAIVCASLSGFGQDGPWASRAAYDTVIQAVGGFISLTGEEKGSGYKCGFSLADIISGSSCLGIVLAALYQAKKTGKGSYIDFSMMDCAASSFLPQIVEYGVTGENPKRYGNQHPSLVPYGTFSCKDGKCVMLCVHSDEEFARFCETLGKPELAKETAYADMASRVANREALNEQINALFADWEQEALCKIMQDHQLACVPVNNVAEAAVMEQLTIRNMTNVKTQWKDGTTVQTTGCPIKILGMQEDILYHGPVMGEDTLEIMSQYGDAEAVNAMYAETIADSIEKTAEKYAKMK